MKMKMNILRLLGLQKIAAKKESYPYEDTLHLWEDDFLMIELLPRENLDFVKAETNRINDFAREHYTGTGFTDITPIAEKSVKTIERLIDLTEVEKIMISSGLERVRHFHMQGVGLLDTDKAPVGFGTNQFAILCERRNTLLEDIWISGRPNKVDEKLRLIDALLMFGQTFDFIGINWFKCTYFNLVERSSVVEFVEAL